MSCHLLTHSKKSKKTRWAVPKLVRCPKHIKTTTFCTPQKRINSSFLIHWQIWWEEERRKRHGHVLWWGYRCHAFVSKRTGCWGSCWWFCQDRGCTSWACQDFVSGVVLIEFNFFFSLVLFAFGNWFHYEYYLFLVLNWMLIMFIALFVFQRLLRMLDGLNFKEFLAFLSAFSPRATLQQKVEYNVVTTHFCYSFVKPYF